MVTSHVFAQNMQFNFKCISRHGCPNCLLDDTILVESDYRAGSIKAAWIPAQRINCNYSSHFCYTANTMWRSAPKFDFSSCQWPNWLNCLSKCHHNYTNTNCKLVRPMSSYAGISNETALSCTHFSGVLLYSFNAELYRYDLVMLWLCTCTPYKSKVLSVWRQMAVKYRSIKKIGITLSSN